jgi:hypothetical protein
MRLKLPFSPYYLMIYVRLILELSPLNDGSRTELSIGTKVFGKQEILFFG